MMPALRSVLSQYHYETLFLHHFGLSISSFPHGFRFVAIIHGNEPAQSRPFPVFPLDHKSDALTTMRPSHLGLGHFALFVSCDLAFDKPCDEWNLFFFFFIGELQGGALPYWWLDAKRPYLLPSSKPCGPRSSRTEGHHRLSSARLSSNQQLV